MRKDYAVQPILFYFSESIMPIKYLMLAMAMMATSLHADELVLRKTLTERSPILKIEKIHATPIQGVFEVVTQERQVFYTDAKGDYVLTGNLIETATRNNLTRQRIEGLNVVDFASLPFNKAIPVIKGKGSRKLAVFSDPDCPYCKQLEKELALLDDVTIYVFLYPIASLHPEATKHAKAIWCAPDRAKSWTAHMLDGKQPSGDGKCDNPVDEIAALGSSLSIDATPTMIFADGTRVSGSQSAGQIEAWLKTSVVATK